MGPLEYQQHAWILILLHTIILHNKMMCHARHTARNPFKGKGHCLSVCLSNISCPGCVFHMFEWSLILLQTMIYYNTMICHTHQPATNFQGQGHSLGSNNIRPQYCV